MEAFTGNPFQWNELVASLPDPHLLQTWEWAQVKTRYGWQAMPFIWKTEAGRIVAAAMVLKRQLLMRGFAARLNILYLSKGPLLDWTDLSLRRQVLDDLQAFARRQGAIFLKLDPDVPLGFGLPGGEGSTEDASGQAVRNELLHRGWRFSSDQIQFRNTAVLDLTGSEDSLLAGMKQKTRYNIRLAERKGVSVRSGKDTDLPMLYRMYAETSIRDGFVIREEGYYQTVWRAFMRSPSGGISPWAEPLIAELDGLPVAAIFIFYFSGRAYYLYGMSSGIHREKMPNYLLQWEAIRRAKQVGCSRYDLWGAPEFSDKTDSLWGVYRFKEGLGGNVLRTLGAWDYAPNPLWYALYTQVVPRLLDVMRRTGRSRTRQSIA
ncbi:MAG: peptidoglycan bridge formation glycyltransferase FemA/FemB family protein [Chloroflexota bacterium]